MGEISCDECGETPHLGPTDREDVMVEVWCECPERVPAVLKALGPGCGGEPSFWGEAGERYVCYGCGESPWMTTSTSSDRTISYNVSCRCDGLSTFGPTIGWRGVMPDKWKCDADQTKWPDIRDEIIDVVEEHGPLDYDELSEHFDIPYEGVMCFVRMLQREDELCRDPDRGMMTQFMMMEYETGTAPEQIEDEQQGYDGTRSSTGWSGWKNMWRRIFG